MHKQHLVIKEGKSKLGVYLDESQVWTLVIKKI